nr:reverse transcriptase domain-containing protein [Tanacetum cinerariifolium]
MLVEVGKLTFPANFVILKMEEDNKVSLILGRPFLHNADAVIRVKQKQLNLDIDVIDEILEEDFNALLDEGSKILHSIKGTLKEEIFFEFDEFIAMTANENSESDTEEPPFDKIIINNDYNIKMSLEEPPTNLELKPLPDNLEKCHFVVKERIVLGHKVSGAGLEVDKAKINVISKLPPATNIKVIAMNSSNSKKISSLRVPLMEWRILLPSSRRALKSSSKISSIISILKHVSSF